MISVMERAFYVHGSRPSAFGGGTLTVVVSAADHGDPHTGFSTEICAGLGRTQASERYEEHIGLVSHAQAPLCATNGTE